MAEKEQANVQQEYPALRPGMPVVSSDDQPVGRVLEVFRDVGTIEAFGTIGMNPQQDGFDPTNYAYSEAMPGAGDNYFTVQRPDGEVLYVPFNGIERVDSRQVKVAVDAENIADVNWTVRPDVLTSVAHEYDEDTGGEPKVA